MSALMTARCVGWKVTVPPGAYFLGDPCYAVPSDLWDDLLASCAVFENPVGTVADCQVLAFGTRWGDGVYCDDEGGRYPVDAGLIGLTPTGLAAQRPDYDQLPSKGRIVSFTHATHCTCNPEGRLTFGPYCIDTNK